MGEGGIWGAPRQRKRRAGGWGQVEGSAGPEVGLASEGLLLGWPQRRRWSFPVIYSCVFLQPLALRLPAKGRFPVEKGLVLRADLRTISRSV